METLCSIGHAWGFLEGERRGSHSYAREESACCHFSFPSPGRPGRDGHEARSGRAISKLPSFKKRRNLELLSCFIEVNSTERLQGDLIRRKWEVLIIRQLQDIWSANGKNRSTPLLARVSNVKTSEKTRELRCCKTETVLQLLTTQHLNICRVFQTFRLVLQYQRHVKC